MTIKVVIVKYARIVVIKIECVECAVEVAVECGLVHCLGWKNGKCNNVKKMLIATRSDLRTCAKPTVGTSILYQSLSSPEILISV